MRLLLYVLLGVLLQSCQDKEIKVNQSKVASAESVEDITPEFSLNEEYTKDKVSFGLVLGYSSNAIVLNNILHRDKANEFSVTQGKTVLNLNINSEVLAQLEKKEFKYVTVAFSSRDDYEFNFFNDYESRLTLKNGSQVETSPISIAHIVTIENSNSSSLKLEFGFFPNRRGGTPSKCQNGKCGGGGIIPPSAPAPVPAPKPNPAPAPAPGNPGKPNPGTCSIPGDIPCGINNGVQRCCNPNIPEECALIDHVLDLYQCKKPNPDRCTMEGRKTQCGPDTKGYRWCCADNEECGAFPDAVCKAKTVPPKTPSNPPPSAPEQCYPSKCPSGQACLKVDSDLNLINCPGPNDDCRCMENNANQPDPGTPPGPPAPGPKPAPPTLPPNIDPNTPYGCQQKGGTWCPIGAGHHTCCEGSNSCNPTGEGCKPSNEPPTTPSNPPEGGEPESCPVTPGEYGCAGHNGDKDVCYTCCNDIKDASPDKCTQNDHEKRANCRKACDDWFSNQSKVE